MILTSASLIGPPVYRLRALTTEDSYGDPVESWATPSKVKLRGAIIQRPKSEEDETPSANTVTEDRVLTVDGKADLTSKDRIEYEGKVYRIDGEVDTRRGLVLGTQTKANLRRISS
jgi:head-tail adaptor